MIPAALAVVVVTTVVLVVVAVKVMRPEWTWEELCFARCVAAAVRHGIVSVNDVRRLCDMVPFLMVDTPLSDHQVEILKRLWLERLLYGAHRPELLP